MDGGKAEACLPLSTASGGLSPSPLLKQCDSYNAYLYINVISAKQLKSAPTEKIGTTLISRNSRFCPSDTIICSIAISYYILLRGDLQSPHKKSYCGFCTGRIMLYCTLFMSASVRVTSHVFQKNYQLDKFRIHINRICKSAFLGRHCLEKGHNASVCCASLKIHVIIFTKP